MNTTENEQHALNPGENEATVDKSKSLEGDFVDGNLVKPIGNNISVNTNNKNDTAVRGNKGMDAGFAFDDLKPLHVKIPTEIKDHSEELKIWAGSHKKSLKERQNAVKTGIFDYVYEFLIFF